MATDPAGSGAAPVAGPPERGWELSWARAPLPAATYDGVHALIASVAARGGAVGWLEVPPPQQTRAWLDGVLAVGARLALARDPDGQVLGAGLWQRRTAAVLAQTAEVRKVMTAPAARGRGVARAVVTALVEDARQAGVELLVLSSRGNNHTALGLYGDLGFVVTGRRPDAIAVGDERFDEVLLHRDLRVGQRPPAAGELRRHGGLRRGPGST